MMPLTTRLDANLGYDCNNDCLFCYFKTRKGHLPSCGTTEAKELIRLISHLGIDTLELTGGEVTQRSDILALVSFAKHSLAFKNISVITNGSLMQDAGFTRRLIEAGVDDVIISIHGHEAKLHDLLVGRTGAFDEALRAVKNIRREGISCRANTVITSLNYRHAPDIAALLREAGITQANYIFFSPLDDALHASCAVWPRYSDAAPCITQMIDRYKDSFDAIAIKVVPFCFMVGYEEHVTDLFQNNYDPFEWDFALRVRVRRGPWVYYMAMTAGLLCFMDIREMAARGLRRSVREGMSRLQAFRECVKAPCCRQCRYDPICPGVWKAYARRFSLRELHPVKGPKVIEADYYLQKRSPPRAPGSAA